MSIIRSFTGKVFYILLLAAAFVLLIYAFDFFLLVFASLLFAVLISYGANGLQNKTGMKYGLALVLVLLLMVGIIVLVVLLIGPSLSDQIAEMKKAIPEALSSLKQRLEQTSWGQSLLDEIPDDPAKMVGDSSSAVSKITSVFSATLGVIANIAIVLVTGIFLAADPALYREGFVRLFPVGQRARMREVLIKCYLTLSSWLMAKFISMAIVGIATGVGLTLMGMPMAWALALIAFLFAFIPNIGPYIALAPAVLIGLMQGNNMALYVLMLYFGIQIVESYLITPLIEKKMVSIPPALMLLWQVLMGIFAGIAGLFLATPVLAACMVLVQELYIKDKLEKGESGLISAEVEG